MRSEPRSRRNVTIPSRICVPRSARSRSWGKIFTTSMLVSIVRRRRCHDVRNSTSTSCSCGFQDREVDVARTLHLFHPIKWKNILLITISPSSSASFMNHTPTCPPRLPLSPRLSRQPCCLRFPSPLSHDAAKRAPNIHPRIARKTFENNCHKDLRDRHRHSPENRSRGPLPSAQFSYHSPSWIYHFHLSFREVKGRKELTCIPLRLTFPVVDVALCFLCSKSSKMFVLGKNCRTRFSMNSTILRQGQ